MLLSVLVSCCSSCSRTSVPSVLLLDVRSPLAPERIMSSRQLSAQARSLAEYQGAAISGPLPLSLRAPEPGATQYLASKCNQPPPGFLAAPHASFFSCPSCSAPGPRTRRPPPASLWACGYPHCRPILRSDASFRPPAAPLAPRRPMGAGGRFAMALHAKPGAFPNTQAGILRI